LFKNGLAVVRRSAEIDGAGVYRLDDVPTPVHGTFWVEADGPVEARVTMRGVDAPLRAGGAGIDFQQELVGRQVTIHFRGEANVPVATGRVVELGRPTGDEAWNRAYTQTRYYGSPDGATPASGQFLVLETPRGRVYADTGLIAFMEVEGNGGNVRQRRPVLLLTTDGKTTAHISYLTRGLAWAPSYRVDLADDKTLSIEQQAVIKNELGDVDDADVSLISGFPSIQFAHVTSPLALSQTWAQFFQQINANPREVGGVGANGYVSQQAVVANNIRGAESVDLSAVPQGEGVDLHYQSIGKRTLAEGDSLSLSVAKASSPYERIVEWVVPDTRDADGRAMDEYRRREDPEKFEDAAWDAVRFRNPLPFAMTTAPAMVIDGGHFAGQRTSYWVNTGEQTTLQVTKALSIRTRAIEQEDADQARQTVSVGGRNYRKVAVKGELTASNHRQKDVTLVIRRQFSGDLVKADGEPKSTLREEGVYSVNRRNELTWTLPLKSGEARTLAYQYTVLIAE
jgi:hypothetical protein